MRTPALAALMGAAGLFLALAACSSADTNVVADGDDAGTADAGRKPGSSSGSTDDDEETDGGKKGDAGKPKPKPELPSTSLSKGDLYLLGVTGEDAIFTDLAATPTTLNAVPLAGGTATKIADLGKDDDATVAGGAVAVWTGIDKDGLGTLNVWTRADGFQASVAAKSGAGGFFIATKDGSRFAFSRDIAPSSGDILSIPIGIRDSGATSNAVDLDGTTASGNAFNFAATDCDATMSFAGNVFFAQFCTGTDEDADTAKLVTVAAGGSTVVRLDAATAGAAPTLKPSPSYVADAAGTAVFVVNKTNDVGRFIVVAGGGDTFDSQIAEATMVKDGSAAVYRTVAGALKKATVGPTVTTELATDVKGIVGASRDGKNVLFNKLDPAASSPLIDLNVVDLTVTPPAPVALVATLGAFPIGVNAESTHALFFSDIKQSSATLKSIPIAGGTATTLVDGLGGLFPDSGNSVVVLSNPHELDAPNDGFEVYDLTVVDSVSGAKKTVAYDVPDGEFFVRGKVLAYSQIGSTGGIFAATLP